MTGNNKYNIGISKERYKDVCRMRKVITYGSFDLFHEGHYRLLQRAKALGDYLIVGVTTEAYDATRGKLNVIDNLMTRIENVRSTGFADEIIIEESPGQKFSDIKKYNIDIFTVGSDWVGTFDHLKDYGKRTGQSRGSGLSVREELQTGSFQRPSWSAGSVPREFITPIRKARLDSQINGILRRIQIWRLFFLPLMLFILHPPMQRIMGI